MRYLRPRSIEEASAALACGARALAGGTDLLVRLGRMVDWPPALVDLKGIDALKGIRPLAPGENGAPGDDEIAPAAGGGELPTGGLRLGALVTLAELKALPELAAWPALAAACRGFAARQIRNRATLGGNLANASPAADTVPVLAAYGARCLTDRRALPVEKLATGPGQTSLAPGEIITALELPAPAAGARSFFFKLAPREAMAIAVVSVAGCLEMEGPVVRRARLVLGSVAPTVIRAREAEAALAGRRLTPEVAREAAAVAAGAARPIDDLRARAGYRRTMVGRIVAYELSRLAREYAHS
ncbi:MAG: FAD binding domain-containing protein [Candidatus Krumholzibacteriota bacterium]|nr:FAD binding domain-containing protein [Candidatus Krumholzibacteriota bacterium]